MTDYHIHPDFSQDAEGSMAEYCARARQIGLVEICFTTHCELDPERKDYEYVRVAGERCPVDSNWGEAYFREIERCRGEFTDLSVRAGVEVGYEFGLEGVIHDFLVQHPFDFVLGAVHCLDHVAITSGDELARFKADYQHHGAEYVAGRYFEYVRAAAGSRLFDCLSHLDAYRKYIQPLFDEGFARTVELQLGPTLRFVAESGTGLEVNSAALRRGMAEPYPAERIVRMARDAGVDVFTTGSDAHAVKDLGVGLDRVEALLGRAGIRPARFRDRKRVDRPQPKSY